MNDFPSEPVPDSAQDRQKPSGNSPRLRPFLRFCRSSFFLCLECLAVGAVLVVLAVSFLLWRLYSGPIQIDFALPYIEDRLESITAGYEYDIQGAEIYWADWNAPFSLRLLDLEVSKAQDPDKPLIKLERIRLELAKHEVFLAQFRPVAIELGGIELNIRRQKDGNLFFAVHAPKTGETVALPPETALGALFAGNEGKTGQDLPWTPGNKEGFARLAKGPLGDLQRISIRDAKLKLSDAHSSLGVEAQAEDLTLQGTADGFELVYMIRLPSSGFLPQEKEPEGAEDPAPQQPRDTTPALWAGKASYTLETGIIDLKGGIQNLRATPLIRTLDWPIKAPALLQSHFQSRIKVTESRQFRPLNAELSLTLQKPARLGFLTEQDFPDLDIGNAKIDLAFDHQTGALTLNGSASQSSAGTLSFDGQLNRDKKGAWDGPLSLQLDQIDPQTALGFWPANFGTRGRKWVQDNVEAKMLAKGEAKFTTAIKVAEGESFRPEFSLAFKNAGFEIRDARVHYHEKLSPLVIKTARAEIDNDQLTIRTKNARQDKMDVTEAAFLLTPLKSPEQRTVHFSANIAGTAGEAFAYAYPETLTFFSESALKVLEQAEFPRDPSKYQGHMEGGISFEFPTGAQWREQLSIAADLHFKKLEIDDFGPLKTLEVPQMDFRLDQEELTLNGRTEWMQSSAEFDYRRRLGIFDNQEVKPRGKGNAEPLARGTFVLDLTLADIRALGLDPGPLVHGRLNTELIYADFGDGSQEIVLSSDMAALQFSIPPFDFTKEQGHTGNFSALIVLENHLPVTAKQVQVATQGFKLEDGSVNFKKKVTEGPFAQRMQGLDFERAVLPRIRSGANDLSFDIARSEDETWLFQIRGNSLDTRTFFNDPPMIVHHPFQASFETDKAVMKSGRELTAFKMFARGPGDGFVHQLEIDAVAGKGDIYLRYQPPEADAKNILRVEADDAGAALSRLGFYDGLEGGKLRIYAEPLQGGTPRDLTGVVRLTDFRVTDAPILARLLNAVSLPGMAGLLGGQGIAFSRAEAEFEWVAADPGYSGHDKRILKIRDGRTSGASLGLTFEGSYDVNRGKINMSGTIVPASTLNRFVSQIPLVGQILSGGSESVFAATYRIKGSTDAPEISVNPLSALAPGLIRELLFQNPSRDGEAPSGAGNDNAAEGAGARNQ